MEFLRRLFGGQQAGAKREEVIKYIAEGLAKGHSEQDRKSFLDFFGDARLAEGQTVNRALAEWHALMIGVMVRGLWLGLHTKEKVLPIIAAFQPVFLKTLSSGCQEEFLKIASQREQEIMEIFPQLRDSRELSRFMNIAVNRIIGHYVELTIDLLRADPSTYMTTLDSVSCDKDFISIVAVEGLVIDNMVAAKKLAERMSPHF